jgi:hypothetical protein
MQDVLWAARSIADVVLVSVASVGETLAFLDTSYTSLLVVGRNRTTRQVAAEAITGLRTARAQPQGLVISDADPKQSPAISG